MASESFALSVAAFAAKAKERANQACSAIAIGILDRVVLRSPVGNPELWAANAGKVAANSEADAANAALRADPANLTKAGRLRAGLKRKKVNLTAGKDYTGGRFRGNWQVTIGGKPAGALDVIDPSGASTKERGRLALAGFEAGPSIFLTNNVPYSIRLEYGHSTQAPAGVVRITVAEFQQIVDEAVRGLK